MFKKWTERETGCLLISPSPGFENLPTALDSSEYKYQTSCVFDVFLRLSIKLEFWFAFFLICMLYRIDSRAGIFFHYNRIFLLSLMDQTWLVMEKNVLQWILIESTLLDSLFWENVSRDILSNNKARLNLIVYVGYVWKDLFISSQDKRDKKRVDTVRHR